MANLIGLPGKPKLWKVGEKSYVIYTIPGTTPPVKLSWEVTNKKELSSFFGPDQEIVYDKVVGPKAFKKMGVLNFGFTAELANFDEDPFLTWVDTMTVQSAVQPWILEPDYQALVAMAVLEGRALTTAEIQSTEWWKAHNEAERAWIELWHSDKATAKQSLSDNRILTLEMLKNAGVEKPSAELVNFMADKVTTGAWTQVKFNAQITAVSDPFSGIKMLPGVAKLVTTKTGVTQAEEDVVSGLLGEWLGPVFGDWGDDRIAKWAGILRNDPDGMIKLEKKLSELRMSFFPGYDDDSLTYEDIASPWRAFATSIWGQTIDETDPFFTKLIQNNDTVLNGELLRRKGLNKGIGKVVQDFESGLLQVGGGSVREVL